jgi:hypothetical protein
MPSPAVPRSIPLCFISLAGFALCRRSGKYFGEQAPLLIYLNVCALLIAISNIFS